MAKMNFKMRNVVAAAICLAAVMMLAGCDKGDDGGGGSKKGWIKYQGKTYDLTGAGATSEVLSVPGVEGTGFTVLLQNSESDYENYVGLVFSYYSSAPALYGATGTYTKATGTVTPGQISHFRTQSNIAGTPFAFVELLDEELKVSYDDKNKIYTFEGFFEQPAEYGGKLEFYYKGDVTIQ